MKLFYIYDARKDYPEFWTIDEDRACVVAESNPDVIVFHMTSDLMTLEFQAEVDRLREMLTRQRREK